MKPLVIIPTYNEVENVASVVDELMGCYEGLSVLVVDDASPDGTGDEADRLARKYLDSVQVLHRSGKEGLGAAYRAGFEWALRRDFSHVVEMDADGSHRPADLQKLLDAASSGIDLVLGSRWVEGGEVVNWPRRREWLSRGASWWARLMLALPTRDATAGFRIYTSDVLRAINVDHVASAGYCFQIDMTRHILSVGGRVSEVPITFVERTEGKSKMSLGIVFEALWRVTWWGIQRHSPLSPTP